MRSRTFSLLMMAFTSALPIGSLLVGAISQRIGVQATVLGEGTLALGIGVWHLRHLRKAKPDQTVPALPTDSAAETALHL